MQNMILLSSVRSVDRRVNSTILRRICVTNTIAGKSNFLLLEDEYFPIVAFGAIGAHDISK